MNVQTPVSHNPGFSMGRNLRDWATIVAIPLVLVSAGCTTAFQTQRQLGIELMADGRYGAALGHLQDAHHMVPEHVDTLCDMAECHISIANQYQSRADQVAAMREIDRAIDYYTRAIRSYPGSGRAWRGKNDALEFRGKHREALAEAEWAAANVGPSARQQLFLARELAERGDADRALLAYRQAVAMEPQSSTAHWAIGLFYIDLQRQGEAISHLQHAYRLDPRRRYIADKLREMGADVPVEQATGDQAG